MVNFFYSTLSYVRDKKNERENLSPDEDPADTDQLHTDVVQLIGGRFLMPEWDTPFHNEMMYRMMMKIVRVTETWLESMQYCE
ncbi:hypothetical protein J41TS8_27150 [Bacillus sp. J41TS8]|nr:hypothetical protein J41TS8_27150 [Bacillus sp. J41TS8]